MYTVQYCSETSEPPNTFQTSLHLQYSPKVMLTQGLLFASASWQLLAATCRMLADESCEPQELLCSKKFKPQELFYVKKTGPQELMER